MTTSLTNIQILRSAVPYKRPDPSFLLDGQLAINYKSAEPGIFTKLQDSGIVKFGPVAITSNSVAPNGAPDATGYAGNSVGEEWLDSRGALYRPVERIYDGANWPTTNGFEVDFQTGNFTLLKALTVSTIEADAASIDGPMMVNGHITPAGTTCAHTLGNASERWQSIFACAGDITGDLSLGGGISVGDNMDIGGGLNVNEDLNVKGNATFGLTCNDGNKFTVKSPTYLNCLVEILGHTQATDVTISEDLIVENNVLIGLGCNNTFTCKSKAIFECDVEFKSSPVNFESLIVTDYCDFQGNTTLGQYCTDTITVKGSASFDNCLTTFEGETRIGLASGSALRTYGPNIFAQDVQSNSNLQLPAGKAYSLPTVDGDPNNTLVTKLWVQDTIEAAYQEWTVSGLTLKTTVPNLSIVPNGGNGTLGLAIDKWDEVWAQVVHMGDLHMKNERGDWTLIEEEDCLTMTNNKTGKRYAISMTPYTG